MTDIRGRYVPLLFLMSLLFGITYIATKYALSELGVFQIVFGRYALAWILLTAILWKKRQYFFIARRDWKHFLLLTFIEPVGYFIFETYGVHFSTPASVSVIIATIPAFAVLFAAIMLKEKPTLTTFLGVALSIGGVYLVIGQQQATALGPHPLLGNLLTVVAAASAGVYNSLVRRLTRRYSFVTITYYQTLVATTVFLPLAIGEYALTGKFSTDWRIVGSVAYLALGASVFGYLILNKALSVIGAAQVAIFANFVPVITILASYLFYKEVLNPVQFVGAALVLIGIYLVYARPAKSPVPKKITSEETDNFPN